MEELRVPRRRVPARIVLDDGRTLILGGQRADVVVRVRVEPEVAAEVRVRLAEVDAVARQVVADGEPGLTATDDDRVHSLARACVVCLS